MPCHLLIQDVYNGKYKHYTTFGNTPAKEIRHMVALGPLPEIQISRAKAAAGITSGRRPVEYGLVTEDRVWDLQSLLLYDWAYYQSTGVDRLRLTEFLLLMGRDEEITQREREKL